MQTQSRLWAWTRHISPRLADLTLVVALSLIGLIGVAVDPFADRGRGPAWLALVAIALLLMATLPLIWRREHPIPVLGIVAAVFPLKILLGLNSTPAGAFAAMIAVYSVAVYSRTRWRSLVGLGAAVLFVLAASAIVVTGNERNLAPLTATAIVLSGAYLLGDFLRTRRAYLTELEAKAARLEREQDDARQRAADEERARIARELHDVVAHDVSLMVVQAGAARTVQSQQPEAAAAALALIEGTGRQTLNELSQLLGVLRKSDGSTAARTPQPGVDQLDALVSELHHAGLVARVTVEGEARALPPALNLSAYRIVQEATTNVLKHARATQVDILVQYQTDGLLLRVHDNGRGPRPSATPNSHGHGLVGMRERVGLFGGSLQAGPSPGGGFTVEARLPLPPVA